MRESEREREREKHQCVRDTLIAQSPSPQLGTWLVTQAGALTRNQTVTFAFTGQGSTYNSLQLVFQLVRAA